MPPRLVAILLALFLVAAGRSIIVSGNDADDDFFEKCPASRCAEGGPEIRFPYRLDSSPLLCGAPGMELSCSGKDTVLALPHAGSFNVTTVDYRYGLITIKLGGSCLHGLTGQPGSINLTSSGYPPDDDIWVISLIGCPRKWTPEDDYHAAGPISCLSTASQFVYLVDAFTYASGLPSYCRVIAADLSIPFRRPTKYDYTWLETAADFKEKVADFIAQGEVTLWWHVPPITDKCVQCEKAKKYCGFSSATNQAFCRQGPNIKLIAATSSAAFVILLLLVVILVYFYTQSKREKEIRLKVEKFLASYNAIKPTRYTFSELKKITKRFKNKLGQGGFGSVYKGELANGIPVAVKMLARSKWDGREFTNEVATIGRIHHFNVVRLLGFCSEGTTHALIYEFMPNESLEKYIFSKGRNALHEPLKMEKLLEIATGIARGIEYLHQGCNQRILHFDIKPHNILLDRNFNPKISDFGLAKLCSRDQSIVTMTAARGTMGYIAPEMYSRNFGAVSYKADVYSFGMLVMEMVGGRRNADPRIENQSEFYFPEWIYDQLVNGQDIGPAIEIANTSEIEIAKKLAIVALWCIQWDPRDRPSMTRVVQMLIGDSQNLPMPPTPFVSSPGQDAVIIAPN
ncbi:rust resistance kinase Lr10-like [Ananas comosus]|uniref:Glycerophosphodiester phosphodiesterase protein kinase domain-containing GDPDL2 n=1 Tax=Ananas comosus TaxID=4615 RepID=A0A199V3S4_ANACO|nr:rust resistance kinase Lr10-like [Ananas comosus]OAY71628.1 Glycerophosphodiester phosphodiesterase protein kinase domain-containing GDPDL2 [Ananas comosus]